MRVVEEVCQLYSSSGLLLDVFSSTVALRKLSPTAKPMFLLETTYF